MKGLFVTLMSLVLGTTLSTPAFAGWAESNDPYDVRLNAPECPEGQVLEKGKCSIVIVKNSVINFDEAKIEGALKTPSMGYSLARKRAQFACDSLKEDQKKWVECINKNYGFREKSKSLSGKLASKFAEDMTCPKDAKDIEELKKLSKEYDRDPFPVDMSDLIAFPLDENSSELEAHLPISCGYNSSQKGWYRVQSYCKNEKDCFTQGLKSETKSHLEMALLENETNLWVLSRNKHGDKSHRYGGISGDGRYVALGNGVFLETYRTPKDGVFYHGLILAPTKTSFVKKACEKEKWLNNSADLLEPNEIKDVKAAIRKLLVQGEALEQVKALTQKIAANKAQLPESALQRLQKKAKTLLGAVEGKTQSKDIKVGESACAELEAITGSQETFSQSDSQAQDATGSSGNGAGSAE